MSPIIDDEFYSAYVEICHAGLRQRQSISDIVNETLRSWKPRSLRVTRQSKGSAMTKRWIEPVALAGSKVLVEPLALEHADGMIEAVKDGELWKLWYTSIPAPEKVEEYIQTALNWRENLYAMPFIVR